MLLSLRIIMLVRTLRRGTTARTGTATSGTSPGARMPPPAAPQRTAQAATASPSRPPGGSLIELLRLLGVTPDDFAHASGMEWTRPLEGVVRAPGSDQQRVEPPPWLTVAQAAQRAQCGPRQSTARPTPGSCARPASVVGATCDFVRRGSTSGWSAVPARGRDAQRA